MKIVISNISKSFNKKKNVLNNLSLNLNDGELTTLLGSSGCGKTTLLRIISGLETPDSGTITFDDSIVFDKEQNINTSPIKRKVAFVFQDFALWPNMTAIKNIEFGIASTIKMKFKDEENKNPFKFYIKKRNAIREKALEALKMVQMEEFADRLPAQLSGGQKQRIAIARAIAIQPNVILFDEPLSALDAILREQMRIEIKELVKKLNITAVFVTHDQQEAMAISDKIIIMDSGKIVEEGTPNEIYWNPKRMFTAKFIGKTSFLSETSFLRPEFIKLKKDASTNTKVSITISSVECIGGYYSITGDSNNIKYFLNSDIKYNILDVIDIFYNNDNIVTLTEKTDIG